ncbi:hypothetical protein [Marinithermofilum abyssi]
MYSEEDVERLRSILQAKPLVSLGSAS